MHTLHSILETGALVSGMDQTVGFKRCASWTVPCVRRQLWVLDAKVCILQALSDNSVFLRTEAQKDQFCQIADLDLLQPPILLPRVFKGNTFEKSSWFQIQWLSSKFVWRDNNGILGEIWHKLVHLMDLRREKCLFTRSGALYFYVGAIIRRLWSGKVIGQTSVCFSF